MGKKRALVMRPCNVFKNQENESRGLKVKRMDFLICRRSTQIGKLQEACW